MWCTDTFINISIDNLWAVNGCAYIWLIDGWQQMCVQAHTQTVTHTKKKKKIQKHVACFQAQWIAVKSENSFVLGGGEKNLIKYI